MMYGALLMTISPYINMHSSHQHPIEIRNILLTLSLIEYHKDFRKENVFGFPIQ